MCTKNGKKNVVDGLERTNHMVVTRVIDRKGNTLWLARLWRPENRSALIGVQQTCHFALSLVELEKIGTVLLDRDFFKRL